MRQTPFISGSAGDEKDAALSVRAGNLFLEGAYSIEKSNPPNKPFLNGGLALDVVILSEAAICTGDEKLKDAASERMQSCLSMLQQVPLSSSLQNGICGIGWVLENYEFGSFKSQTDTILSDLDELISENLGATNNPSVDIIDGLAGIVVYASSRRANTHSAKQLWRALEEVIYPILQSWPNTSSTGSRDPIQEGLIDLGVAHGVPGLLSVLGVACNYDLVSIQMRRTVNRCLDQFWEVLQSSHGGVRIPYKIGGENEARLAWCYGGLGLSAMFANARTLSDENNARAIVCSKYSIDSYWRGENKLSDASFCHGFTGAAFLFNFLKMRLSCEEELSSRLHLCAEDACIKALDIIESKRNEKPSPNDVLEPPENLLEGRLSATMAVAGIFGDKLPSWTSLVGLQ